MKTLTKEELGLIDSRTKELIYNAAIKILVGYCSNYKFSGIGFAQIDSLQDKCIYAATSMAIQCGLLDGKVIKGEESEDKDPASELEN